MENEMKSAISPATGPQTATFAIGAPQPPLAIGDQQRDPQDRLAKNGRHAKIMQCGM
jgi:hypothetical protein